MKPSTAAARGGAGEQRRRGLLTYLLASASTFAALLWSSAALVALFTPVYTVRGEFLQATLALTHYSIVFMGHSVRHPLLEALRVQLFPLTVGVVLIALASVVNVFRAALRLQQGKPLGGVVNVNLIVALLATVSTGPLEASTRIVDAVLAELRSTVRYNTSAGVIVLGALQVAPGPAYTVLEALNPTPLLLLTLLLLAVSTLAAAHPYTRGSS